MAQRGSFKSVGSIAATPFSSLLSRGEADWLSHVKLNRNGCKLAVTDMTGGWSHNQREITADEAVCNSTTTESRTARKRVSGMRILLWGRGACNACASSMFDGQIMHS